MSPTKTYFDNLALEYSAKSHRGFWAYLRKKEKKAVMKAIEPFQRMSLIELGCGSGYYTSLLTEYNPTTLVAVDYSYPMISNVRIKNALRICGDIQNITFRLCFDRILCAGVLEFLPNLQLFFSNVKTFLDENGTMTLLLPRKSLWGFIYKLFHRSHGITIRLYDFPELESMLKNLGWKIEAWESPTPMTIVLKLTHAYTE